MAKKKDFTGDPGGLIGDTIWSAVKPLYKEARRQERAARAPRRTYYAPMPKFYIKDMVFEVLPRAITNAGANFSARDLYYATRALAYNHSEWESGKTLDYGYFSQSLLTEYQEHRGLIAGLWRDARGHFHEPHTGRSVALGTREIAAYEFPEYTFDKILYVEKEGELPKLQAARLGERYDMAICSGKGQPTEAVRDLLSHAEGGDYQLFVFHDADLDGYDIARVLGAATRRMPDHNVEVVDLGLTVEDAVEMGLPSEPFHRKKDISWGLRMRLSEVAEEYLYNKGYRGVSGYRFELNAILPDTRRVEYIERKLQENGVRGKVIPPDDKLGEMADEKYRALSAGWVADAIDDLISSEEFEKEIADEFAERFGLDEARRHIEEHFETDRAASWRDALEKKLEDIRGEAPLADAFKAAVEKKLRDRLREGLGE